MARTESDREDLIAEATALVRRAEIATAGFAGPVVVGFRRDGGLSVYFGADPAYHFDPDGRLKRAYRNGLLYRTQGETLAELNRERTPAETVLRRRDLSGEELRAFLDDMADRLSALLAAIEDGRAAVVRQVPDGDETFVADVADRLRRADAGLAPRFKGKR